MSEAKVEDEDDCSLTSIVACSGQGGSQSDCPHKPSIPVLPISSTADPPERVKLFGVMVAVKFVPRGELDCHRVPSRPPLSCGHREPANQGDGIIGKVEQTTRPVNTA